MASGNEKDVVPWSAIVNAGLEVYITGEYVPEDYVFMEPTRIKMDAGKALLDFWRDRESKGWVAVEFHNYLGADGKVVQAERFASVVHAEAKKGREGGPSAVQGKGKGKALVNVPRTTQAARKKKTLQTGEDAEAGSEENTTGPVIFKVPRPKRKARRNKVSAEDQASGTSDQEDFTTAMNIIDSDEEEHGGPSGPSTVVLKPPGTSPADVGQSADERKKYLQSLSTEKVYQDMLDAIYSLVVSRYAVRSSIPVDISTL